MRTCLNADGAWVAGSFAAAVAAGKRPERTGEASLERIGYMATVDDGQTVCVVERAVRMVGPTLVRARIVPAADIYLPLAVV